jgi:hypothetical protein
VKDSADVVEKVVALVVHNHSHCAQRNYVVSKFKRHLDDRRMFVQVFEGVQSYVFPHLHCLFFIVFY